MYTCTTFVLTVISCSVAQHYSNVTQVPAVCESNWIPVGPLCYFVHQKPVAWNDARKNCETQGAHLAEPLTREDNQRLTLSMFSRGCKHGLWIGLIRGNDKKIYYQRNNQSVTYKGMQHIQLDRGHENCLSMNCWGWKHFKCSKKLKFLCEKQAEAPTTTSVATTTVSSAPTTTTTTTTTTRTTATTTATTTINPTDVSPLLIISQDEFDVATTTAMVLLPPRKEAESGANCLLVCTPCVILLPVVMAVSLHLSSTVLVTDL